MPRYRVSKSFVVESGHMLSKHAESCRFPHGHTRRVELVVSCETLDANDMVVDFKALKLAVREIVDRYDHRMALNSNDPLLPALLETHPDGILVYENQDPTTEVMAREVYDYAAKVLAEGFEAKSPSGARYSIPAGTVRLERVRVTETDTSWAEYGD